MPFDKLNRVYRVVEGGFNSLFEMLYFEIPGGGAERSVSILCLRCAAVERHR